MKASPVPAATGMKSVNDRAPRAVVAGKNMGPHGNKTSTSYKQLATKQAPVKSNAKRPQYL